MSDPDGLDPEDVLRLANAASAGRRPYFFDDRDVDRLLAIVWAMAGELAVTRERLDTVERLLEERALLPREEIEMYRPDAAAAAERGRWQMEYVARLLRILQQEMDAMQRGGAAEPAAEELARELGDRVP
jgi:hypothetical protein